MADQFADYADGPGLGSVRAAAITPSDTTDFLVTGFVPKALYVGNTGDLRVILVGDTAAVTFPNVPGGTTIAVRPKKVMATGTTATGIVGYL